MTQTARDDGQAHGAAAASRKDLVGLSAFGLRFGRNAGFLGLTLILMALTVYPLVMLIYGSLHSTPPGVPGEFNLNGYRQVFTARNLDILFTSFTISIIKTVLSISIAILLAWIIARTDTPWRRQLEILITLPFFLPPVLTAMGWGMLGNPTVGLLNVAWKWLSGSNQSIFNVYSYGGIIWHMMQYSTPFLFMLIVDAFRAMDPALEESSRMSGASRWRTFRSITLVLVLPVLTSAFILSFIRSIEAFEAPLFFGIPARIRMITIEIFEAINFRANSDYQYATALSFVVMTLLLLLVVGQWWWLRGRSFQTVTGRGYAPQLVKLGPWRWVTFAFCMLFFIVTVVLPIGQLLIGSFFKFFGVYRAELVTLDHYRNVFSNAEFWRALRNTLILGLFGATATMILGGLVAYVTVRTRWRGRWFLEGLAWLPWLMPGIVLGIGLLWSFSLLPHAIPLYGTIWALFVAYVALGTPLSVRIMSGAYAQLSFDLEECSRVLGASWWQTLRRILLALMWPSFAVGWVLTFFGIMRELSASVLLYSAGSEVLSVVVMKLWLNGEAGQVCVIGLLMIALVILFRWVQLRFINRKVSVL